MLIHTKLPPGVIYPQLTQFPENYDDFLAAFRDGQTLDRNNLLTTADTLQTNMYKTALASKHLETKGNPIQGESLVDVFLTGMGAERILIPVDRQFCEMAVELARKSVSENDGRLHPYVGAVVVKNGRVLATGYRGETAAGRHAEFCALKKLNDDVDNVDLIGCTVYTTLEPCSERKPKKIACATRLIKANAARVVSGMPDKDREVYGLSQLAEAKTHSVTVNHAGLHGKIDTPKTQNALRTLAVSPQLAKLLAEQIERQKSKEHQFLFSSSTATPWDTGRRHVPKNWMET